MMKFTNMTRLFFLLLAVTVCSCSSAQKSKSTKSKKTTVSGKATQTKQVLLSKYASLNDAVTEATAKQWPLLIDKNITVDKEIVLNDGITIVGKKGVTIFNKAKRLFVYNAGKYIFKDLNIQSVAGCAIFKSDISRSTVNVWSITIDRCFINNSAQVIWNDRGGNGSQLNIKNSHFHTSHNPVIVYNQNGSEMVFKSEGNVYKSDTSHLWYIHPNVSIESVGDSLFQLGVGTNGHRAIAVHHYSGGGVPGVAKFVRYRNLFSEAPVEICNNDGKFIMPKNGVEISNSSLAIYNSVVPEMVISNSNIFFGFIKGKILNCTGKIFPADGTRIEGGTYEKEIDLQLGGKVEMVGVTAASILTGKNPVSPVQLNLTNCKVKAWRLPADYKVTLKNTPQPDGLWGWKASQKSITMIK